MNQIRYISANLAFIRDQNNNISVVRFEKYSKMNIETQIPEDDNLNLIPMKKNKTQKEPLFLYIREDTSYL